MKKSEFFNYCGENIAESLDCVAKSLFFEETKSEKHYIRICSRGTESGLFFNPLVHGKGALHKKDEATGRDRFSFRAVSLASFNLYLQFLKSGNVSFLRNAQRN